MSSFKTKTIALITSSLIVAVAGLSFATTPAFAKAKQTLKPIIGIKNPKKQVYAGAAPTKKATAAKAVRIPAIPAKNLRRR